MSSCVKWCFAIATVTRGSSGTSETLDTYVATSPDDRSPARAVMTHSSRSNRSKIFVNASTPTIVAPHKFDPNDGPILRYFAVRCQSAPAQDSADHLVHLQVRRMLDKIEAKPRL